MAAQIKLRRRQKKTRNEATNSHVDENVQLFPHLFNMNSYCFSGSSKISKQRKKMKQFIVSGSKLKHFKDTKQEELIVTPELPTHSQYLQRQHLQLPSQLPSNFPLVEQFTSEITQNQHRQPIYLSFNNSPQQQYCINAQSQTITFNIPIYLNNAAMRNNSIQNTVAPQLYLLSQQRSVGGHFLVYSQPSLQPILSQLCHQQVATLVSNTSQQIVSQQKQNFLQQISTTSQQTANTSSLYEWFSSLPTSILAQIPPTNLIHN
uniref:Uncharacterized protein n=1 Tax=Meloidogyne enterolobii TaxID=390850 RepID=A0A6V7W1E5_MELEN|nr:unnamed protein product [Meloidogyne enterolobii]